MTSPTDALQQDRHRFSFGQLGREISFVFFPGLMFWPGNFWSKIVGGISLAGAAYGLVLLVISYVLAAVEVINGPLWGINSGLLLDTQLTHLFGMAVSCSIVGTFCAGFMSLIILPLAYWIVRTLEIRIRPARFGATCGGVVGFICTLPGLVLLNYSIMSRHFIWQWFVLLLVCGPALATMVGQWGGAWGGRRAEAYTAREWVIEWPGEKPKRFQFGIRQVLWFATWLGLLLGGISVLGVPFELALPLLAGWLVYQSATLAIGWLVICRFWPRWRALRARRFT